MKDRSLTRKISNKESLAISLLRVVGCVFIVICHLAQESQYSIIQMSAQLFTVGVPIFFIISAFIYSKKQIGQPVNWLVQRGKRILIPMYLLVGIIMGYSIIILNKNIDLKTLGIYIFNAQGFTGGKLRGTGHLWFLSVLMICYILTPCLEKIKSSFDRKALIKIVIIGMMLQILLAIFYSKLIGIYLAHVCIYTIVYMFSDEEVYNVKNYIILAIITGIATLFRFYLKTIDDRTSRDLIHALYECIVVPYSMGILGLWVTSTVFYMVRKFEFLNKFKKIILHIERYSFEIYLVHYMYIVGPFNLLDTTNSRILNIGIVLIITYISSRLLYTCEQIIYKKI